MKKNYSKNLLFGILALSLSFASCTSSTVIKSIPEEAKVYLNDEFVGTTPYRMSDDKIIYSDTYVELKKDGYKDFSTVITKDENFNAGACLGGVFLGFPFLWVLDYKPTHTYELTPIGPDQPNTNSEPANGNTIKL